MAALVAINSASTCLDYGIIDSSSCTTFEAKRDAIVSLANRQLALTTNSYKELD